MITELSYDQVLEFIKAVDHSFPISLSKKQPLEDLTNKFLKHGIACAKVINGEVIAAVFGYIEHVIDDLAYISVVATKSGYQEKGYASECVKEFLEIVRAKGLKGVHLYSVSGNKAAIRMYEKIGFQNYIISEETRPDDVHLIYYTRSRE